MYAYIDAYVDRVEDEEHAAFVAAVEATRAAVIFAEHAATRQYQAWRRKMNAQAKAEPEKVGLTGAALEKAVNIFAAQHPEYVVVGGNA